MNGADIIKLLWDTGHIHRPFGERDRAAPSLEKLQQQPLNHTIIRDAILSYQQFNSALLEQFAAEIWPTSSSPRIIPGYVDLATEKLLSTARCACPDYASAQQESLGSGNWKSCHGIGNFHAAKVRFATEPPSFLEAHMPTIWQRVVDAYADIGLLFERDDSEQGNIDISFVQPSGGWIGLAIVGSGQSCSDSIWAKFDRNYRPANLISEWTTLIKHELGHNCGLDHASGGVMNPYIISGLPVSWRGDPSFPLLANRFGGQPIPTAPPKSRTLCIGWLEADGSFELWQTLDKIPDGGTWPT